jgi:signal peptidase II
MQRRHHWQHLIPYAGLALWVFVGDQLSKYWAVARLTQAFAYLSPETPWLQKLSIFLWKQHPLPAEIVTVMRHFWHYRYVENPGAAWGVLSGSASALRTPFFLVISIFAMGFILTYFRRSEAHQRLLRVGLSLVFGGAIGNFCDRLRLGYVIDFIDWHWYQKATWPTFNVADAGISIGVILLLLDMVSTPQPTGRVSLEESSEL